MQEGKLTPVLVQAPLTVAYRVGNPLGTLLHAGADWIMGVVVSVKGDPSQEVNITVGNTDRLLQPDLISHEAPLPGAPLSTIRVSVGGKQLPAGIHTLPQMLVKATFINSTRRIGAGYVERVDVVTADFHMRVTSAHTKKFKNEQLQVRRPPSWCHAPLPSDHTARIRCASALLRRDGGWPGSRSRLAFY